jgi:hypothetical protein
MKNGMVIIDADGHPADNEAVNRESGRPATLGSTLAAHLQLIVWCKECRHQVESRFCPGLARIVLEEDIPGASAEP